GQPCAPAVFRGVCGGLGGLGFDFPEGSRWVSCAPPRSPLPPAADVVEVAVPVNDQRGAAVGNERRLFTGRRPPLEPPGPMVRLLEVYAGESPLRIQSEPVPGLFVDVGELAFRVDLPQARVDVGDEDIALLVDDDARAGMSRSPPCEQGK